MHSSLMDLPTPCLILDEARLERNLSRMAKRAHALGVDLRPHCKTAKSAEVARRATQGFSGAITVATLNEAEYFADHGFNEITYAVCIEPGKLARIAALQKRGVRIRVITDNVEMARMLAEKAASLPAPLPVLIEIDAELHRTGIPHDSPELIAIGKCLHEAPNIELDGVLAFGGKSYSQSSVEGIRAFAEVERHCATAAAERLRAASLPCPTVSVGATPSAMFAASLDGVTEMRPGVYVFMDLMQVALGVCGYEDVAVTVLASVVSHNRAHNRIYIDAGALALSKDHGIARSGQLHAPYGLVGSVVSAAPWEDLGVTDVNQEHGFVTRLSSGAPLPFEALPVGARVRVLPNHVCHTIGSYDRYYVLDKAGNPTKEWDRTVGW